MQTWIGLQAGHSHHWNDVLFCPLALLAEQRKKSLGLTQVADGGNSTDQTLKEENNRLTQTDRYADKESDRQTETATNRTTDKVQGPVLIR